jgi:hypothetical protein
VILVELILLGDLLDAMEHALAEEPGIEPAPQTEVAKRVECGPPTLMFSGVQRPVTARTFRQRLRTAKSLVSTGDALSGLMVVACGFIRQPS